MSRKHLIFSGREQLIDVEQDETTGETILHYRQCENVKQTKKISKEEFEMTVFNLLKNKFF